MTLSELRSPAPLFCVPGPGINAVDFSALGTCLSAAMPVHGLRATGFGWDKDGVQAAAEFHVRTIRRLHPSGPIHLLGSASGGWVAYEMALRIRGAGGTAGMLTLLDSDVPRAARADLTESDEREQLQSLLETLDRGAERSFGIAHEETDSLDKVTRARLLQPRLRRFSLLLRGSSLSVATGSVPASMGRGSAYEPSDTYGGLVCLVLFGDPALDEASDLRRAAGQVAAWRRWAPKLSSAVCPGNRVTALRSPTNVQVLASHLLEDRKSPIVVTDARMLPGHQMFGPWALPGVPYSFLDCGALWTFTSLREPHLVRFSEICVKPSDWEGEKAPHAARVRYQGADTSFPGWLVDGMPNPCDRRYRMIDGRRRIHKLIRQGVEEGEFYVYRPEEVAPFIRGIELRSLQSPPASDRPRPS